MVDGVAVHAVGVAIIVIIAIVPNGKVSLFDCHMLMIDIRFKTQMNISATIPHPFQLV